ncbi:NUDIX hydrolase [Caryophanon tenue]|uniref:NUDIX hydrolase n=1 Tax=Caryophanon tenue TaxID=33978 RepID=A0A1C0Y700_9BACL|nr:NUDIX hydrolase [Caryophanon tenue]OCS82930.1 NUDIX hydrolase [Caryophanon tenue]
MTVKQMITNYVATNEQEQQDKVQILACLDTFDDVLTRKNTIAHFTCSGLVFNAARTHVLMVHHNIYDSWGWTGGHADGEADFLAVAQREVLEETGVEATPIIKDILSLDVLNVLGHVKNGEFVSAHLHLNVTYVFEADEQAALTVKEDENSGVAWIAIEDIHQKVNEAHMKPIYDKIVNRVKNGNHL